MAIKNAVRYHRLNPTRKLNKLVDDASASESIDAQIGQRKTRWAAMSALAERIKAHWEHRSGSPAASFDAFVKAHGLSDAEIKKWIGRYNAMRDAYCLVGGLLFVAATLAAVMGYPVQFFCFLLLSVLGGVKGFQAELEAWRFRNRRFGSIKDYFS